MNAHTDVRSLDELLDAATDAQGRLRFIQALASSRAWVIADQDWDGHRKPARGTQILMVSDGADRRQPMAAVFTARSHAERYLQGIPGGGHDFRHPAEPPMAWVLLGLPTGAGIMVNPGGARAFRIAPEIAMDLSRNAEQSLRSLPPIAQPAQTVIPPLLQEVYDALDAGDITKADTAIVRLEQSGIGREYVLVAKAVMAKHLSDYPKARDLYSEALTLTNDRSLTGELWWLLAQVHIDAGEPELAEQAFIAAHEADPSRPEFLIDLANFHAAGGDVEKALQCLRKAIDEYPAEPGYPITLGRVLMDANRHEEALEYFNRLMESHPALKALALFNRAMCLQVLGNLPDAKDSLEQALTLDPSLNGHQQYANLLKTFEGGLPASDRYIEFLQRRTQDDVPINSRIDSYYTLSKIHESMGDYDRAFECMQRANTLKRTTIKWSMADSEAEFARMIKLFDRDFIAHCRGLAASDLKPIFVLGMPRSGTTLTEQILAAHSQVNPGGELNHLHKLGTAFVAAWSHEDAAAPERQAQLKAALAHVADGYTSLTAGFQDGGKRFTDKMPGNFMFLGLIYLLFPGASVVHCLRDPVDNCLSCFERQFSKGLFFSYDLQELAAYYRLYRRIMRHWREVLPEKFILDLQYEEMVAEPEGQIRRLLDFCGLPFEAACMNFHEVKRTVKTASVLQVRQPMYKTSVARWKKYGDRLAPLVEALGPELAPH